MGKRHKRFGYQAFLSVSHQTPHTEEGLVAETLCLFPIVDEHLIKQEKKTVLVSADHNFLYIVTLFPNEMQNLLSSEKRTLDHWATVQFFFSTAQVRRFWRCLWFRSGLVALFLKTSERGDSWCTDSSFSPLLVKLSQVFESALLDCILKLAVIPVGCAPFPTQILPSSQLCI